MAGVVQRGSEESEPPLLGPDQSIYEEIPDVLNIYLLSDFQK